MTANMKKFLELISENKELALKMKDASKDDIIALAKTLGIELTDADFEQSAEISDDELNAVAGGDACVCAFGGGGAASKGEKTCVCVGGGGGQFKDGTARCACPIGGLGVMADED